MALTFAVNFMLTVKKIGTGLVWDFFKGICILGVQDTIDVFFFGGGGKGVAGC